MYPQSIEDRMSEICCVNFLVLADNDLELKFVENPTKLIAIASHIKPKKPSVTVSAIADVSSMM